MINFGLNSASFLAQVNFGANSASILGIFLAVAGAALYFLRTVRPELSRDQDIFFAAVGLLCGFILVFQGWRLDPILQFGQLLLVGTTVFFAVESIRLRSIATQQAKRNTPIVDEDRPVSDRYSYNDRRKYQAEMDADLDPLPYEEEERPVRPRIRGSKDEISTRDDYYEEQPPRRSERRNSSSSEKQAPADKTRRRTSGRTVNRPSESSEEENWGSSSRQVDDWESSGGEVRKPSRRTNNGSGRPESREDDVAPRPRRRRPPTDSTPRRGREDDEAIPTDYVPYNPVEKPNEGPDNSTDFDDDV
ncbi:Ycf66 family protein [Nostoc sp.]|uniref:Ycf66 family protein n=1 Tax=Nostoc sp. TaxID=1180 RepID=UPI002FFAC5BA